VYITKMLTSKTVCLRHGVWNKMILVIFLQLAVISCACALIVLTIYPVTVCYSYHSVNYHNAITPKEK